VARGDVLPCPHGMPNAKTCIQCMEEGPVEKIGGKLKTGEWIRAHFAGTCANNRSHTISEDDWIGNVAGVGWCCEECAE
jgi:hypothetical protein